MSSQEGLKPVQLHFQHYVPEKCDLSSAPLLFVHGIAAAHTTWSKVLKPIAENARRQAYAIDVRNHGESEWSDCFTLEALKGDIENFLSEQGIGRCIFIGHSLGGRIGIALALTKPDLLERVIVEECGVSNYSEEDMQKVTSLLSRARTVSALPPGMSEAQVRQLIRRVARQQFSDTPGLDMLYYIPLRQGPDGSYRLNFHFEAVERHSRDGSLSNIDFDRCSAFPRPSLFVCADSSQMIADKDEKLKEFFLDARFAYFKKTAHSLHVVCAEEFIEKVTSFINT